MRLALGDHVLSQDGHNLGKVKHLLLDSATEQVKKIVVEKGFFLPDDIEVPLDAFQSVDAGEIHLNLSAEQFKTLPRFDENLYAPLPPDRISYFPEYPTGGVLWPAGYAAAPFTAASYSLMTAGFPMAAPIMTDDAMPVKSPEVQAYRHHEDVTNAVISEGDMVLSQDGMKVGEVHSIVVDTETGRPTVLVVRKGFLFIEDTTLLADSIASVEDGVITLRLDRQQLPA